MNFATALLLRKERWLRSSYPRAAFTSHWTRYTILLLSRNKLFVYYCLRVIAHTYIYIYFLEPFQNRDRACQYFRIEIIEFNLIPCYYLISCNPPIVPFERKFFRIILNLTRSIFRRCKSDLMNCIFLVNLTWLV